MSRTNDPPGGIDRRRALHLLAGTVGGTVSLPVLSEGAKGRESAPETQEPEIVINPKFFSRDELQVIDVLSKSSSLPMAIQLGARAAHMPAFTDELVSQSSETTRQRWRHGPCANRVVSEVASVFCRSERATVDGYYRSAIGIHKDLEYQGNKYRLAFSGCDH